MGFLQGSHTRPWETLAKLSLISKDTVIKIRVYCQGCGPIILEEEIAVLQVL
jgi:hypothetical protein